jgi:hypothetical protein
MYPLDILRDPGGFLRRGATFNGEIAFTYGLLHRFYSKCDRRRNEHDEDCLTNIYQDENL